MLHLIAPTLLCGFITLFYRHCKWTGINKVWIFSPVSVCPPFHQTDQKKEPPAKETSKEASKEAESCYRYEGEECFYTEPASGAVFRWDKTAGSWAQVSTDQNKASINKGGESGVKV